MEKVGTEVINEDRDSRLGFQLSLAAHVALLALILFKTAVFPGDPLPIPPTLRVDIVGLPDLLKKDKVPLPPAPQDSPPLDQLSEALKQAEAAARKTKPIPIPEVQEADPNEMVAKLQAKPEPKSKSKNAQDTQRERKLKSALDRIKSLSKITEEESPTTGRLVKGNRISRGASLSDDAKESMESSYYDELRAHLQANWALPVWLSRQQLSAQVQLYLDGRGRITNFRLARSSGNPQFDEQVKRTLQESQPFPLPPAAIARELSAKGVLIGFPL